MFAIRVLPAHERGPEGETLGEITVGSFTERFACVVGPTTETEWRAELQALVDGNSIATLVHDPRFAWVIYRRGDLCFVQQCFVADGNFREMPSRVTVTDEGEAVSEWGTTVGAVRKFLHG